MFDLLILFIIASLFGWVVEVIICYVDGYGILNRGLLNGPVCPIYGFTSVGMVVFASYFNNNLLLAFVLGALLASAIEYAVHYFLEKNYQLKLWNYSKEFLNLNGRICLKNSIEFGFGSVLLVAAVFPFLMSLFVGHSKLKIFFSLVGIFLIGADFIITIILADRLKPFFISDSVIADLRKNRKHRNEIFKERARELDRKIKAVNKRFSMSVADYFVLRRIFRAFPKARAFRHKK